MYYFSVGSFDLNQSYVKPVLTLYMFVKPCSASKLLATFVLEPLLQIKIIFLFKFLLDASYISFKKVLLNTL